MLQRPSLPHMLACAQQVSVMAGLACHVEMASWWALHVVSWHYGQILHAVIGWQWQWTFMWQRWRQPWACMQ